MIYFDEFHRNGQIVEEVMRHLRGVRLRGVRLNYREGQILIDSILHAMDVRDSNAILEEMYDYLNEQFRRSDDNERSMRQSMRQISERPRYRMTPEEEYQKHIFELQLELTKKQTELKAKELEFKAKDFLSEDECKIE